VNEDDVSTKAHLKPKPVSVREMHRRRLEKIRIYYKEGTFYSAPIAYNVYNLLSREMRFENVGDLLWLACVGVTDAYIHNRLDLCGYAQFSTELKGHVNRVYPDYSGSEGLLRRNANIIFSESLYERAGLVDGPKTQIGLSENGRIVTQNDELRFFLLRHTNLLEAMRLSPHVCTKMELYKSSGMKKLQEMLAKMGLPLAQCQQHYAFMNPNLKRRLKENIREHAEVRSNSFDCLFFSLGSCRLILPLIKQEFSLDNVSYTGFLRVTGYKSLISASDMCYAITALLECEPSNKIIKPKVDSQSIPDTQEDEEMRLMTSFNVAYDALNANGGTLSLSGDCGGVSGYLEGSDLSTLVNGSDLSSSNGLGAGLKMALALQRTIISTAVSLVERKAIQRLTHFRYAYLNCTSQGPTGGLGHGLTFGSIKSSRNGLNADADIFHIFTKPLALTKLATFLMDMHRTNGKWAGVRASPLILMAENPQTQTYLVVGYECQEHSDKNRFGQNFVLAAKTMRGTFKFDSFDSNVVEVKATEVQKFIEQLHFVMEETK
jgi:cell division control protein 45